MVWLFSRMRLRKNSFPHDEKEKNLCNHSETPSFDAKAYNLAEGPLSATCLLWSLWKSAQIRPTCKPLKISMHMLSGGLIEAGSKALQSFCLRYTCFILHCSSKVPAMSMLYPKPAGAAKTFPVIATSACQIPPPHWALGWKTQTISSETSVVICSIQRNHPDLNTEE